MLPVGQGILTQAGLIHLCTFQEVSSQRLPIVSCVTDSAVVSKRAAVCDLSGSHHHEGNIHRHKTSFQTEIIYASP